MDVASAVEIPNLIAKDPGQRGLLFRILIAIAAFIVIVAGFIGWVMPVVPGVPLIVAGAGMLGLCSRRAARWINEAEARLPRKWRLRLRPKLRKSLRREALFKPPAATDLLQQLLQERAASGGPPAESASQSKDLPRSPLTISRRDQ